MRSGTILTWTRVGLLISGGAVFLIWCIGQILRDSSWLSGLAFYLPSPCLAAGLLLAAGLSAFQKWRESRVYLTLAIAPIWAVLMIENQWVTPDVSAISPAESFRIVHWNICHGLPGWKSQKAAIIALDPDLIVLSETTKEVSADVFPGYQTLPVQNMLVACRMPTDPSPQRLRARMTASGHLVSGGSVKAFLVKCPVGEETLEVMIADHTSNPRVWRDPELRRLTAAIDQYQPDIVVGDLNAPRRSLALQVLPNGYRHAYESAGAGWSYTWPVPFPCLAIDQCLISASVNPADYQLKSTLLSDHRIQILDFRWPLQKASIDRPH
jgi:vancomycin resistance protein VanJ